MYNDAKIEAEIYKINENKILLRHEKWEWIDKNSNRLFPVWSLKLYQISYTSHFLHNNNQKRNHGHTQTADMIKRRIDDDTDDDELYFALNRKNVSSDEEDGDSYINNKYEKKNKKLGMIYQFANNDDDQFEDTPSLQNKNTYKKHVDYDDSVTTEEVFSCIKVLKKIKKSPQILNTPLFNPIHSYLKQLSEITNSSAFQIGRAQLLSRNSELWNKERLTIN